MRYCSLAIAWICLPMANAAVYFSQEHLRLDGKYDETVYAAAGDLTTQFTALKDLYLAGGEVRLQGKTPENVFVAGGDLSAELLQARLGAVAGGQVRIQKSQLRTLILAAGVADLRDVALSEDLTVAVGKLVLDPSVTIGGSLTGAAGDLRCQGKIKGTTRLYGGQVQLSGDFGVDVEVTAGELEVGPKARIHGNLTYTAEKAQISPEAQITGTTVVRPRAESLWGWRALGIGATIVFALVAIGFMLLPLGISFLFPARVKKGFALVREAPFEMLGRGMVALLAVPLVMVLLGITGIGLAFAGVLALLFGVALLVAWAIAVNFVGDQLHRGFAKLAKRRSPENRKPALLWILLGSFALCLLCQIPVLGCLASGILVLCGLGTLTKGLGKNGFALE